MEMAIAEFPIVENNNCIICMIESIHFIAVQPLLNAIIKLYNWIEYWSCPVQTTLSVKLIHYKHQQL